MGGGAHLELNASGLGAVAAMAGTAYLGLNGSGTLTASPPITMSATSVLPSLTQSATGTFAPPRPGDRPGVGSYALMMATIVVGGGAVAAYVAEHNTAGSLEAMCTMLVILRSLPRD